MIKKKNATNRGLVRTIVLIVVGLLILAYFGFNLREIVSSDTFIDNWSFIRSIAGDIWANYLKLPLAYVWNNLFLPYVWNPIIENIANRAGQGLD